MKIFYVGFLLYLLCYLQVSPVIAFIQSIDAQDAIDRGDQKSKISLRNMEKLSETLEILAKYLDRKENVFLENAQRNTLTEGARPKRSLALIALLTTIGSLTAAEAATAKARGRRDTGDLLQDLFNTTKVNEEVSTLDDSSRPKRGVVMIAVGVLTSIGAGIAAHQINKAIDRGRRDTATVLDTTLNNDSTNLNKTVQGEPGSRRKRAVLAGLAAIALGASIGITGGMASHKINKAIDKRMKNKNADIDDRQYVSKDYVQQREFLKLP